jgi:hypothetical protein
MRVFGFADLTARRSSRALGRRAGAIALGAFLVAVYAAPALAAAPANDTIAGATPATIGFSEVLDTTAATTDADDAQLNASCGAPATDASVWYTLTVTADAGVIIDVSASDYSAGVLVGVGSPGALDTIACGPGVVAISASPGTTYYVLAIDDQLDGGGNGGSLHISFNEAPPPPTIDFTVNRTGTVNARTGVATISGTYSCENGDFVDIFVDASQRVGRFTIRGFGEFFDVTTCDGTSHTWSAQVVPDNGKFAGGKAMTVTFAETCGVIECADGFLEQTIQLRGAH